MDIKFQEKVTSKKYFWELKCFELKMISNLRLGPPPSIYPFQDHQQNQNGGMEVVCDQITPFCDQILNNIWSLNRSLEVF